MFCKRCLHLALGLIHDPSARPHAELMSGAGIWDDETCRGWCMPCINSTRLLFRARYCMTIGDPVSEDVRVRWDLARKQVPDWPLFRPDRRDLSLATEVRRLVDRLNAECLGDEEAPSQP
jgi:hypothetical protein